MFCGAFRSANKLDNAWNSSVLEYDVSLRKEQCLSHAGRCDIRVNLECRQPQGRLRRRNCGLGVRASSRISQVQGIQGMKLEAVSVYGVGCTHTHRDVCFGCLYVNENMLN